MGWLISFWQENAHLMETFKDINVYSKLDSHLVYLTYNQTIQIAYVTAFRDVLRFEPSSLMCKTYAQSCWNIHMIHISPSWCSVSAYFLYLFGTHHLLTLYQIYIFFANVPWNFFSCKCGQWSIPVLCSKLILCHSNVVISCFSVENNHIVCVFLWSYGVQCLVLLKSKLPQVYVFPHFHLWFWNHCVRLSTVRSTPPVLTSQLEYRLLLILWYLLLTLTTITTHISLLLNFISSDLRSDLIYLFNLALFASEEWQILGIVSRPLSGINLLMDHALDMRGLSLFGSSSIREVFRHSPMSSITWK